MAKVALQVFIDPKCYRVGEQTVGAREPIDSLFSNSELEWSTNQQGATIIYGLLINVAAATTAAQMNSFDGPASLSRRTGAQVEACDSLSS